MKILSILLLIAAIVIAGVFTMSLARAAKDRDEEWKGDKKDD